jgi:hypothetical protein
MGHSSYTIDTHVNYSHAVSDRALLRSRSGTAALTAHTIDIQEGRAARGVHAKMNPRQATRESRDSAAHPNSTPVAVFFDVTGSMKTIPALFLKRLPSLLQMLALRGYVPDPQVLFGAVGDAVSDDGPVQVGQFESSTEMDADLERVWLEGGGGGGRKESYELAHYFVARHVATDAWEKRRRKGYLFTIGDEGFYGEIPARIAREVFGDDNAETLRTSAVVKELQERWHVFHLVAEQGSYRHDAEIRKQWTDLLGEDHVISLEDSAKVAEMIGLAVGLTEGTVQAATARADLAQLGLTEADADQLIAALAKVADRGIRIREEA